MANKRCLQALTRHYTSIISPSSSSLQYLKILNPQLQALALINPSQILSPKFHHISTYIRSNCYTQFTIARHFSSNQRYNKDNEEEDEDNDEDDDEEEIDDSNDDENVSASNSSVEREYSPEEKENEAAAIGYKVIGPLQRSDRVCKDYEPVFAVIQIGSHQFKVSNGDCIYTEKLKFCEVHDKCQDHENNRTVAVKRIFFLNGNEGVPCSVIREIALLKDLDHCNIVNTALDTRMVTLPRELPTSHLKSSS